MKKPISITEAAKPFYFAGGKVGVLLLHGFTGTPYIFQAIGKELHKAGYTVSAPLLAGHGTTPDDLTPTTEADWYKSAEKALFKLRKTTKDVYVIGASYGGVLACKLAAKYHVKGLVLICTPRWLNKHLLANIFTPIFILFGIKYYGKAIARSTEEGALLGGPNLSYLKIPMRSVKEFFRSMASLDSGILEKIKIPTLIIQSTTDGLVNPRSGHYFFKNIKSENKQLTWITEQHHELHTGKSRQQIYRLISDFMVRWTE